MNKLLKLHVLVSGKSCQQLPRLDIGEFVAKSVKAVVSLLTEDCKVNKHMNNINLTEKNIYRFSQEEEKTVYMLYCSESLENMRFPEVGHE